MEDTCRKVPICYIILFWAAPPTFLLPFYFSQRSIWRSYYAHANTRKGPGGVMIASHPGERQQLCPVLSNTVSFSPVCTERWPMQWWYIKLWSSMPFIAYGEHVAATCWGRHFCWGLNIQVQRAADSSWEPVPFPFTCCREQRHRNNIRKLQKWLNRCQRKRNVHRVQCVKRFASIAPRTVKT